MTKIAVSLYNITVNYFTGYKPNEILFKQSNEMDRRKVVEISQKIFSKEISNLKKTKQRMELKKN